MIDAIGQTPAASVAARHMAVSAGVSAELAFTPLGAGTSADTTAAGMLKRPQQDIVHVGFGQGTVSVPGAVVRTIDKNIQGVKRLTTPDITKAKKAASHTALSAPDVTDSLSVVSAMSSAVRTTEARLAGEKPPSDTVNATLTINGQSVSYLPSARQEPVSLSGATRLNVLV